MVTYDINLLIGKDNPDKGLAVKCNDTGVNFRVHLNTATLLSKWRSEEKKYIIPERSTCVLKIEKPSKKFVIIDGEASASSILFKIPEDSTAFAEVGVSSAEVSVYNERGRRITSATFNIEVLKECGSDGGQDSGNYVSLLANLIKEIKDAKISAEEAAKKAKEIVDNFNGGGSSTHARIGDVNLTADGWIGDESPYAQVVEIDGVTENTQVDLTPSVEQLAVFYNKDLAFVTENEDGVVTVYAIGQKPQNDYTIQVTLTEVNV